MRFQKFIKSMDPVETATSVAPFPALPPDAPNVKPPPAVVVGVVVVTKVVAGVVEEVVTVVEVGVVVAAVTPVVLLLLVDPVSSPSWQAANRSAKPIAARLSKFFS
jgi:hypothetical protein